MPFAIHMIWREQKDYFMDCYFCNVNVCNVNVCEFTVKTKHMIVYPNFELARRPVPNNDPIPIPPENGLQMTKDVFLKKILLLWMTPK